MKPKNLVVIGLVGSVAFVSGGWLLQRGGADAGNVYQQARMFESVVAYVADYYVDEIGEREIYDKAIDGLLKELKDPYTSFLRPDDFERLTVSTTGNYGGLGIRIEVSDGWITVVAPLPETPAERVGVQAGDRIVEVEGESTFEWSLDRAVDQLRGPAGDTAHITIMRPGFPEPMKYDVVRERIHVKSVQYGAVLPGGIGYIQLNPVSESSAQELALAVDSLRDAGARSLILDLRNNPGGLLNEGVGVTDLFLDKGQVVVETRGRAPGASGVFRARQEQRWPDMPLVVLVNQNSASAAEIIAGALQDHDRALILGMPTFGKGLVQTVFEMGPGPQALKITTGRWHTPSGRQLERPTRRSFVMAPADEDEGDEPEAGTPADTTAKFITDSGRVVYGGGGIRPDRVIEPEALTDLEQAFARALGAKIPDYRSVMTTYALELKGAGRITNPDFQVTRAMRNEFVRRLRERDINVADSLWAGAAGLLDDQLGYEVARYVFGRPSEVRRQIGQDRQVQEAITLLNRAANVRELLTLAARAEEDRSRN
ncbi:MAG TPA: S41 family peptidase [Gemmatimonadales bacterium]